VSKPPRIDRKTLRTPDGFVTKGRETLQYFVRQQNRFVPILIVVVVAVVAIYGYDWFAKNQLEKGWTALNTTMKLPEAERWEKLKTLHGDLKKGRPAFFAAVTLADHYFDEAKKEGSATAKENATASAEWYLRATAEPSLLPGEVQLLFINRGGALEIANQWEDAAGAYQKAADLAGDAKGLALLGLARVQEAKGDQTKAIENYEKVSADFATNEYGKMAKSSLRRLKSPLFEVPKS